MFSYYPNCNNKCQEDNFISSKCITILYLYLLRWWLQRMLEGNNSEIKLIFILKLKWLSPLFVIYITWLTNKVLVHLYFYLIHLNIFYQKKITLFIRGKSRSLSFFWGMISLSFGYIYIISCMIKFLLVKEWNRSDQKKKKEEWNRLQEWCINLTQD